MTVFYAVKVLYSSPVWLVEARTEGLDYCPSNTPHVAHGPFDSHVAALTYIAEHGQ